MVWHMQIAEFLRNWPLLGTKRAFSLDCDAFLASPADVLTRLDDIFSLELGSEHVKALLTASLFGCTTYTVPVAAATATPPMLPSSLSLPLSKPAPKLSSLGQ